MNKLALIVVAAFPFALMGCPSNSAAKTCAADADCSTEATNPLCDGDTKVCVPAECTENTQCQATDSGGSASCTSDGDCTTAGDKCVTGSVDTKHCVTPQAAGDPACSAGAANLTEVTVDGVTFCGDTGVNCKAPGVCQGGNFPAH